MITCGADTLKLYFHVFSQKRIRNFGLLKLGKPKGFQKGLQRGSKGASTCLHGKQVCDSVEVGKAGGAKQIEQVGAKQIEHAGGAKK